MLLKSLLLFQLCETWAEDQRANQTNCLTEEQMRTLATAMREYIHSQDSTSLDRYLNELVKETITYGNWSMEELQRSIYSLNEAVSRTIMSSTKLLYFFDYFLSLIFVIIW